MGVRGRKSAADLRLVKPSKRAATGGPPPPGYIKLAEQQLWRDIVKAYPDDRFPRATWPMLEAYVRHSIQMRKIGLLVDEVSISEDASLADYRMVLCMLNEQTKAVASFGVRLGIARTSMGGRHNKDPDQTREKQQTPWS